MAHTLTPHAIPLISDDENKSSDPSFQPILQVMNVKKLSSAPGSQERYRIIISDGTHFLQGMLASQLTPLVTGGSLQANCLIQLKAYMRNRVQNTTICIALEIDVTHPPMGLIGNPSPYGEKAGAAAPPPAAAANPLYNSTNGNPAAAAVTPPKKYGSSPPKSNPYGQQRTSPASGGGGTAPIVRSHVVPSMYTPIKELNMYQNRWTIRARLVSKGEVRTWSNAKGEGRLFSVELQDESCDIRATFFKEAVDKFYNMLQVSQVYTFAGGRLKVANQQYNTCKSSYEVSFDQNAEIHLDTSSDAQRLSASAPLYEFVKIDAIEQVPEKQAVDVLGVVSQVGEVATILSKKSGREMTKVDVTLVDDSAAQINLTFWGQTATDVTQQLQPNDSILAIRRARVSDYSGKSLSGCQSHQVWRLSQVQTLDEPLRSQALAIAQWWQSQGGSTAAVKSLTSARSGGGARAALAERRPLASIRQDHLGTSADSADIISVKAEVSFIKKDKEGGAWYTACPEAGEPCKNRYKVTPTTDGQYHCEKCGRYYPNCTRRWIFSALLEDESSSNWVSFFNEQAEVLLDGATADEVYAATNSMDGSATDTYEGYFAKALHSEWVFRCKVRQEMVNDEPRTKTSVIGLFPVDYVQDSKDMLAALQI